MFMLYRETCFWNGTVKHICNIRLWFVYINIVLCSIVVSRLYTDRFVCRLWVASTSSQQFCQRHIYSARGSRPVCV